MVLEDEGEVVAHATIIEHGDRDKEVFGIKLGDDYFCISIDVTVDEDAIVSVSIRGKNWTVKEVFGQYVPWPKQWVQQKVQSLTPFLIL